MSRQASQAGMMQFQLELPSSLHQRSFPRISRNRLPRNRFLGANSACALSPKGVITMNESCPDDRSREAWAATLLATKQVEDSAARPAPRISASTVSRLLCGLWFSLLLMVWPSSDWIGLLALSQALLAAACLLKSPSDRAGATPAASGGQVAIEQGENHAH